MAISDMHITPWSSEGPSIYSGSAYPTAAGQGTYNVGDWIVNTAPTAGGTAAWVCTAAGSPGTWKVIALAS